MFLVLAGCIVGILLLFKGADYVVEWSKWLAQHMGISKVLIGLIVLSFGSNMPDFMINIFSAIEWHTALAVGNILGTTLFNTLCILGLAVVLWGVVWDKIIYQNFIFELLFIVLFGFVSIEALDNVVWIGWWWGIILLVAVIFYGGILYRTHKRQIRDEARIIVPGNIKRIICMLLLWICALLLWSHIMVQSAIGLVQTFNISERIIGLTVLSASSSLPELVTMIMSIRKWHAEIGISNLIGSNIFSIAIISWFIGLFQPLNFSTGTYVDLYITIIVTILVIAFISFDRRYSMSKWQGGVLLAIYVVYVIMICLFGS